VRKAVLDATRKFLDRAAERRRRDEGGDAGDVLGRTGDGRSQPVSSKVFETVV
jgi:hypothetical protein